LTSLTLIAVTLAGQIGEAPDRLITPQGVELANDGRIFVLFAALNGLGFSEETQRKGPPLAAPVFHPVRTQVREAMRKLDEAGKLTDLRKFFDANPASVESYAAALLSQDLTLEKSSGEPSAEAKKLGGVISVVQKLGNDPDLTKVFEDVLVLQRKHSKELYDRLDKTFVAGKKHLAVAELRPSLSLIVIPNPLDAHGAVRSVYVGDKLYLLVGPGLDTANTAILEAALRSTVFPSIKAAYANSPKLKKAWGDLKPFKSISNRYSDGDAYAAETVAQILSFQIRGGAAGSPAEDDFVDQATKEGLRWTRPLLLAIGNRGAEPIDASLTKALPKATP